MRAILVGYGLVVAAGLIAGAATASSQCPNHCIDQTQGCTNLNRSTTGLCCIDPTGGMANSCNSCLRDYYYCPGAYVYLGAPYGCVDSYDPCL